MRLFLFSIAIFLFSLSAEAQSMSTADHTMNAGKVEWQERQILMENLPQGTPVSRIFTVKNVSKEDLLLLEVKPSCVCTSVEYDQQPIKPGQTTQIKVTYDAAKAGEFYRIVSVKTNFDETQAVALVISGNVLPPPPPPTEQKSGE